MSRGSGRRYLIVSADSHVGPSLRHQLRDYCEAKHLEAFDGYVAAREHAGNATAPDDAQPDPVGAGSAHGFGRETAQDRWATSAATPGLQDPRKRLEDMDSDGIAAEAIFAGGQNEEAIPFEGSGDRVLEAVGKRIYNRWLADFVAVAPERHVGIVEIPIWDLDATLREITWARDSGLKAVNFPAPVSRPRRVRRAPVRTLLVGLRGPGLLAQLPQRRR